MISYLDTLSYVRINGIITPENNKMRLGHGDSSIVKTKSLCERKVTTMG